MRELKKLRILQIADEEYLKNNPNIKDYMEDVNSKVEEYKEYCADIYDTEIYYELIDWTRYDLPEHVKNLYHYPKSYYIPLITDYVRYNEMRKCPTLFIDCDVQLVDNNIFAKILPLFDVEKEECLWLWTELEMDTRCTPCNGIMMSDERSIPVLDRILEIWNNQVKIGSGMSKTIWGQKIFDEIPMKYLVLMDPTCFFPDPFYSRTADKVNRLTHFTENTIGWHHFDKGTPFSEGARLLKEARSNLIGVSF